MPGTSRRIAALPAALFTVLASAAPVAAAAPGIVNKPMIQVGGMHHLRDPHGRLLNSTSTNWSGYAATGQTFTSVSSSWVQPTVDCSSGDTTYSSFWVGLDGDGSSSVEQTGTEADCSGGQASYSSWYEMYPAYPVNYSDTVSPGDSFTATVSTDGSGNFTLTLTDNTAGWTETQNQSSSSASLASAEVIAEAPSDSSGPLPLSDFGSVDFTGSTANGNPIGNYTSDPMNMVSSSGTTEASTSSLSSGEDFSVTWDAE
jgi:hypothetical protein